MTSILRISNPLVAGSIPAGRALTLRILRNPGWDGFGLERKEMLTRTQLSSRGVVQW